MPWSQNETDLMLYANLLSDVISHNEHRENLLEELSDELYERKHRGEL